MLDKIEEWVFEEYETYNRQTIENYLLSTEQKLQEQFANDSIQDESQPYNLSELINNLLQFDETIKQYRAHLARREIYCREVPGKVGFYEVDWDSFVENNPRFITNWISSIRLSLSSAEFVRFRAVDIGIADNLEEIEAHLQESLHESKLQDEKFFVCVEKVTVDNLTVVYSHVGLADTSNFGDVRIAKRRTKPSSLNDMRTIYMFRIVVIKQDLHL